MEKNDVKLQISEVILMVTLMTCQKTQSFPGAEHLAKWPPEVIQIVTDE